MQRMLTTVDNPFDPFNDFDAWYAFDLALDHDTLGLLARVAVTSPNLSEADEDQAIEMAIDQIIQENVTGLHRAVTANA